MRRAIFATGFDAWDFIDVGEHARAIGEVADFRGNIVAIVHGVLDIVARAVAVDDRRLDEDHEFATVFGGFVVREQLAEVGDIAEDGDAGFVFIILADDQPAKDDGLVVRNRGGGEDFAGRDFRHGEVAAIAAAAGDGLSPILFIIEHGDLHGDGFVVIDQRDDFEFEDDVLVLDLGAAAAAVVGVAAGGDGDAFAAGDGALLVVRGEDARSGKHREVGLGLQRFQEHAHVAKFAVGAQARACERLGIEFWEASGGSGGQWDDGESPAAAADAIRAIE